MECLETIADKLSAAGWSWDIAARSRRTVGAGLLMRARAMLGGASSNLTSC